MKFSAIDRPPFFPDPLLGWSFFLVLLGFALVAAWCDLKTRAIPKWIPLVLLGLGVVFQLVRGAWLGGNVWVLGDRGSFVGALDALLFALTGFALGFALFFAMWILRICGGGDVKLFATVGVWIGPVWALWVLVGSTVILIMQSIVGLSVAALTCGMTATVNQSGSSRVLQRGMTYSLPLAVALGLIMLWFWRFDLGLATRPALADRSATTISPGGGPCA